MICPNQNEGAPEPALSLAKGSLAFGDRGGTPGAPALPILETWERDWLPSSLCP